ncbi:hypothetical protein PTUN_a0878 [Pseudoalteromonas tunicata]|nr:hypothetical protein PTUN_a0878 [Pseudoalteromonas tunicata]
MRYSKCLLFAYIRLLFESDTAKNSACYSVVIGLIFYV